jgi:hypothetical protein
VTGEVEPVDEPGQPAAVIQRSGAELGHPFGVAVMNRRSWSSAFRVVIVAPL